jgi:hypothetical protein
LDDGAQSTFSKHVTVCRVLLIRNEKQACPLVGLAQSIRATALLQLTVQDYRQHHLGADLLSLLWLFLFSWKANH